MITLNKTEIAVIVAALLEAKNKEKDHSIQLYDLPISKVKQGVFQLDLMESVMVSRALFSKAQRLERINADIAAFNLLDLSIRFYRVAKILKEDFKKSNEGGRLA